MSVARCIVTVNGKVEHDEQFVLDFKDVARISYPGLTVLGKRIEVAFEFDPPLLRAPAAEEGRRDAGE